MSPFWSQRSSGTAARIPSSSHDRRNGGSAPVSERAAREARHQETIEASFDRAEAYERLGDFEHALEWLDRAAAVSGGLPPAYRARRARWARAAAVRPRAAGGDWKRRLTRSYEGAAGR
jgi:tetratricopeptide (TPR) repeat protein